MNNPDNSDLQIRTDIDLGADLEYLRGLPQFQRVIEKACISDILMYESQNMISMSPEVRQQTMEQIMSVTYLRNRLAGIVQQAEKAKQDEAE